MAQPSLTNSSNLQLSHDDAEIVQYATSDPSTCVSPAPALSPKKSVSG